MSSDLSNFKAFVISTHMEVSGFDFHFVCHFQSVVEIDRNSLSINTKRPTFWAPKCDCAKYMYPNQHYLPAPPMGHHHYTSSQSAWALLLYCTTETFTPLRRSLLMKRNTGNWDPYVGNIPQETSQRMLPSVSGPHGGHPRGGSHAHTSPE